MGREFAARTDVPIERSRAEIERMLERYRAQAFMYAQERKAFVLAFELRGRNVRFILKRAGEDDEEIRIVTLRGGKKKRLTDIQAEDKAAQENRRRWRALVLILKAKLEAVHSGIVSMDEEFLPYMQLPNGQTVAEWSATELVPSLKAGEMPRGLLGDGRQ